MDPERAPAAAPDYRARTGEVASAPGPDRSLPRPSPRGRARMEGSLLHPDTGLQRADFFNNWIKSPSGATSGKLEQFNISLLFGHRFGRYKVTFCFRDTKFFHCYFARYKMLLYCTIGIDLVVDTMCIRNMYLVNLEL